MKNNPYQPGTTEWEIYERGYSDATHKSPPKPKCKTCNGAGFLSNYKKLPCPFPEIQDMYGSFSFGPCPGCYGTGEEGALPPIWWNCSECVPFS